MLRWENERSWLIRCSFGFQPNTPYDGREFDPGCTQRCLPKSSRSCCQRRPGACRNPKQKPGNRHALLCVYLYFPLPCLCHHQKSRCQLQDFYGKKTPCCRIAGGYTKASQRGDSSACGSAPRTGPGISPSTCQPSAGHVGPWILGVLLLLMDATGSRGRACPECVSITAAPLKRKLWGGVGGPRTDGSNPLPA